MQRRRLRDLVAGPPPDPARVFFTSLWFKGHNNPRYAELLPRLSRLDAYLLTFSDARIRRGLQYRAYRWGSRLRNPAVFALANRRYRTMFTADNEQLALLSRAGRLGRGRSDVQPAGGRAHAAAEPGRVRRHR